MKHFPQLITEIESHLKEQHTARKEKYSHTLWQSEKCRFYGTDYPTILNLQHPYCWRNGFNLYSLLALYNSVLVRIFPSSSEKQFEEFHKIKISELPDLIWLAEKKKVIFIFPKPLSEYSNLPFLKPIIELQLFTHAPNDYESIQEKRAALDLIKYADEEIGRLVAQQKTQLALDFWVRNVSNNDTKQEIEHHLNNTYIDLVLLGMEPLANNIVENISSNPLKAISDMRTVRGLVTIPILDEFKGINTYSHIEILEKEKWFNKAQGPKFQFPQEIGTELFDKIKIYLPQDIESLKWYEDNVDLVNVKSAFAFLQNTVFEKKTEDFTSLNNLTQEILNSYEDTINALEKRSVNGYIITAAVIGATVGLIPGVGFLAGLGVSIGSGLCTSRLTEYYIKNKVPQPIFNILRPCNNSV